MMNLLYFKLSYTLILLIWLDMASHTQTNKFSKSLQYLKKEVSDEADFLSK